LLALTTVSEELGQGKKNFRCRIRSAWSLPAKLVFWGVAASVALLIVFLAESFPWLWLSLTALPLVGWIFDEQREEYERSLARLLDTAAQERGLVKLRPPL
jgi:hypothetical protein